MRKKDIFFVHSKKSKKERKIVEYLTLLMEKAGLDPEGTGRVQQGH